MNNILQVVQDHIIEALYRAQPNSTTRPLPEEVVVRYDGAKRIEALDTEGDLIFSQELVKAEPHWGELVRFTARVVSRSMRHLYDQGVRDQQRKTREVLGIKDA